MLLVATNSGSEKLATRKRSGVAERLRSARSEACCVGSTCTRTFMFGLAFSNAAIIRVCAAARGSFWLFGSRNVA